MTSDLYDTLGVPPDASPDEIKAAYRAKAKQHHPDKGGDAEQFGALQKAYDVLSDAGRRQRYDETGATDTMDRATRIDAMAREKFGAMLIAEIQGDSPALFRKDWIAEAKRQVAKDRARVTVDRKVLRGKAELAGKLADRFKPKTARNIPKDVLSHVQRDINRTLEQAEEKLEVLDRLEVLLAEYQFEADPAPPTTCYASGTSNPYADTFAGLFQRRTGLG